MRSLSVKMLFAAAVTSFWMLAPANAAIVTVGLPAIPNNGNCIPFSCPVLQGLTAFQQVYTDTAFSGVFVISGIEFFNTQFLNGNTALAGGTYTLSLSTTSRPVGGLDPTSPTNNLGPDNQIFFSGPLGSVSGGVKVFAGTPFSYNPALGNLLLTVTFTSPSDSPFVFLDQSQTEAATSFAAFTTFGTFAEPGLVTAFTTSVPEPSTLVMVALALGLCCLVRYRLRA
jgi:hypothetical protein